MGNEALSSVFVNDCLWVVFHLSEERESHQRMFGQPAAQGCV